MKNLGKSIRKARKARGITQADVARRMAVSREAVSQWESGASDPSAANLLWLRAMTGLDLNAVADDLVGRVIACEREK